MKISAAMLVFNIILLYGALLRGAAGCGQHVTHGETVDVVQRHLQHQAVLQALTDKGGELQEMRAFGIQPQLDPAVDSSPHNHHHHNHDKHELSHEQADHQHIHDHHSTAGAAHEHHITESMSGILEPEVLSVPLSRSRSLLQARPPAPIRISVSYQSMGALDAGQRALLETVVGAVVRVVQKFINVKQPVQGGLLVDPICIEYRGRSCTRWYPNFASSSFIGRDCGLAAVQPAHIVNYNTCTGQTADGSLINCRSFGNPGGFGEATDMYMYITAVQNKDCQAGAAAWARPCLLDVETNRPLMGSANICPYALSVMDSEALIAVVTHEFIHALGFTNSMFNLTIDEHGNKRSPDKVVQSYTVPNGGGTVSRIVTPRVQAYVRSHFGCSSLSGAQLEDQGGEGSAGSHWEYGLFQGELMLASTIFAGGGTPPRMSRLTLAFLEDSGWYTTNTGQASYLDWGENAGCSLPNLSCSDYMAATPGQSLFCDPSNSVSSGSQACTPSFKASGRCRSLNFTGRCGLLVSRDAAETCISTDAKYTYDLPNTFGWYNGQSGACLPVTYKFTVSQNGYRYTFPGDGANGAKDAACFNTKCSNGQLIVSMLGQDMVCPAGQSINLAQAFPGRFLTGSIGPCPPTNSVCQYRGCANCNSMGGECRNGACYCRLVYSGSSCNNNLISNTVVTDGSNSSSGGGSSSGGKWVQVIQITVQASNSVPDLSARQANFVAVLAQWASVSPSQISIVNITTPPLAGNTTSIPANSTNQNAFISSTDNQMLHSPARRSLASSMQGASSAASLFLAAAADTLHAWLHGAHADGRPGGMEGSVMHPQLHRELQVVTAQSQVIAQVTTASSNEALIINQRLKDATQVSQLSAALRSSSIIILPSSIVTGTSYTQAPANTGTQSPSPFTPRSSTISESEANKTNQWIMIAAIAAGGGALAIVTVGIVVAVVRKRRKRSNQNAFASAGVHHTIGTTLPPPPPAFTVGPAAARPGYGPADNCNPIYGYPAQSQVLVHAYPEAPGQYPGMHMGYPQQPQR